MKKSNTQNAWIDGLKRMVGTIIGFGLYHLVKRKQFVLILSSMRSGSTLLKALLAEAPEVEQLEELHFEITGNKFYVYWVFFRYSKQSIVVIKQPAFYNNAAVYPQLPSLECKAIILIRHPVECLLSIKDMNQRLGHPQSEEEIIDYWVQVYGNMVPLQKKENVMVLQYEALTQSPEQLTLDLFQFIGSKRTSGTATYAPPQRGGWEWGKGDGGHVIRSQRVQLNVRTYDHKNPFVQKILRSKAVSVIAEKYGIKMRTV